MTRTVVLEQPMDRGKAARKRIVVVDDNEVVRQVLSEFLGAAYTVDVASNAVGVLQLMACNPPDLILLDIDTPGIAGRTLLEAFHQAGAPVPIFAMARHDTPAVRERAARNGAAACLSKPVDLRRLDTLIAGALGVSPFLS
jgi:CheY-like chemotaxis protein